MKSTLAAPQIYLKVTAEKPGAQNLSTTFLVNPSSAQSARRMGEILAYITSADGFSTITKITAPEALREVISAFGPDAAHLPVNNVAFIGRPFNLLPTVFWRRVRAIVRQTT